MSIRRQETQPKRRLEGVGRMGLALLGGCLFAILAWNPRPPPIVEPVDGADGPSPPSRSTANLSTNHRTENAADIELASDHAQFYQPTALHSPRNSNDARRGARNKNVPEKNRSLAMTAEDAAAATPIANSRGPPR